MNIFKAASDPMAAAKEAILKEAKTYDHFGKHGVPDAIEVLDAGEAALKGLEAFFSGIDAEEAADILQALNAFRKPANRQSDADIQALAAKVVAIGPALHVAEQVLENIEQELKK